MYGVGYFFLCSLQLCSTPLLVRRIISLKCIIVKYCLERPPSTPAHDLSMSASVPRRQAPPPPNGNSNYDLRDTDCSYDIPNNIVLQPILEANSPILLNIFYRIGIYHDGNFFLVQVSNK